MATTRKKKAGTYRVLRGLSLRRSLDKRSPLYEEFDRWEVGEVVDEFPDRLNIPETIEAGGIEVIDG